MRMKLYKHEAEASLHRRAIESLAQQEQAPVDDVRMVYEAELESMKSYARVEQFLPTLARRRALAVLRRRRGR